MKSIFKFLVPLFAVGLGIAVYDSESTKHRDANDSTSSSLISGKVSKTVALNKVTTKARETPVFLKEQNDGISLQEIEASFDDEAFTSSLSEQELLDMTKVPEVLIEMVESGVSVDELAQKLADAGYNPMQSKKGHEKTGFRREVSIEKNRDGLLLDVYSSYLEHEGRLYFDRLYFTYEPKDGVFQKLVKDLDGQFDSLAINKIVKEGYVRWNLPGEKFVFVDAKFIKDDEPVVFVGHEFEIH